MRIVLYFHAGSKNHGCEAIVRSTKRILSDEEVLLFSSAIQEDEKYGLNKLVSLNEDNYAISEIGPLKKTIAAISHKIYHNDSLFYVYGHANFFNQIKKGDICMSIGGDNYCYEGQDILGYYNKELHRRGAKTVLWGCSVDPDTFDESIKKDLSLYDLIIAREMISFKCLKEINKNTYLLPDPAFGLDCADISLPSGFKQGKMIGINASPLAALYGDSNLFFQNYIELINYILKNTDYSIALIPHVVKDENDDRVVLQRLIETVNDNQRITLIPDMNCMELKTVISNCEMFIGARTHATIAAYSMCVPTIVTGYSIKAKGIAIELFGTDKNYVVPVQSFTNPYHLQNAFIWLIDNSQSIKKHLESIMPAYKESIMKARELLFA